MSSEMAKGLITHVCDTCLEDGGALWRGQETGIWDGNWGGGGGVCTFYGDFLMSMSCAL